MEFSGGIIPGYHIAVPVSSGKHTLSELPEQ